MHLHKFDDIKKLPDFQKQMEKQEKRNDTVHKNKISIIPIKGTWWAARHVHIKQYIKICN